MPPHCSRSAHSSSRRETSRSRESEPGYRNRRKTVRRRTVAELAEGVVAPTLDGAVAEEDADVLEALLVVVAHGHGNRARDSGHGDGNGAAHRAAIAELPTVAAAPALNRAILQKRAADGAAGRNRRCCA